MGNDETADSDQGDPWDYLLAGSGTLMVTFPVFTFTRVVKLAPRGQPCGQQTWTLIVYWCSQWLCMSMQQHNQADGNQTHARLWLLHLTSHHTAYKSRVATHAGACHYNTGMKIVPPWRAWLHVNTLFSENEYKKKEKISKELWQWLHFWEPKTLSFF